MRGAVIDAVRRRARAPPGRRAPPSKPATRRVSVSEVKLSAETPHRVRQGCRPADSAGPARCPPCCTATAPSPCTSPCRATSSMLALKTSNVLLSPRRSSGGTAAGAAQGRPARPGHATSSSTSTCVLVRRGEKVTVEVPVHVTGEPGRRRPGRPASSTRSPSRPRRPSIPQSVEVSVEGLEPGTQIHAGDVALPAGATLAADPDAIAASRRRRPTGAERSSESRRRETARGRRAEGADGAAAPRRPTTAGRGRLTARGGGPELRTRRRSGLAGRRAGQPRAAVRGNRHNVGCMVVDAARGRPRRQVGAHRSGPRSRGAARAGRRAAGAPRRARRADVVHERVRRARWRRLANSSRSRRSGSSSSTTSSTCRSATLSSSAAAARAGTTACGRSAQSLGTRRLPARSRFGIGRPPGRMDPADFVLRDFSSTERKELDFVVSDAADAVHSVVADGLGARPEPGQHEPERPVTPSDRTRRSAVTRPLPGKHVVSVGTGRNLP